jgi:DNA polymerase III subunit epsilon
MVDQMREIVFDTETTGLDPKSGHRIVELGAIELVNLVETGRTLHLYFNPDRSMPKEAEAVHGLSDRFLSDKPRFQVHADEILEFFGDSHLIAHNAGFDFGFLDAEFALCGRRPLDRTRMIDTVAMARRIHPGAKHTLDALCTRYGIDRSRRVKHGALLDSELLAQLYVEMKGGRQIGLDMARVDAGPGAPQASHTPPIAAPTIARTARVHRASPEELARHAAFVATLSNPIWTAAGE